MEKPHYVFMLTDFYKAVEFNGDGLRGSTILIYGWKRPRTSILALNEHILSILAHFQLSIKNYIYINISVFILHVKDQ